MLTSDHLILVELHKGGSSRVKKLLGEIVGGESTGKRAGTAEELAATGKPVVGYLCNPLTWYLSLWQQGCAGKGDLHKRLTDPERWEQLRSRRAARPAKATSRPGMLDIPAEWGADHAKTAWYGDAEDPEAFRAWLKAILATRSIRRLVDSGYANSPINKLGGLMTYQLFVSLVCGADTLDKSIDTPEALEALGATNAITRLFIRAESVAADLHQVLESLGIALTEAQRSAIDGVKERGQADAKAIQRFYDVPSLRMVAKRDELISKLFGYTAPTVPADEVPKKPKKGDDAASDKTAQKKKTKGDAAQKQQAREARQAKKASALQAAKDPAAVTSAGATKKAKAPGAKAGAASGKPKAEKLARKQGKPQKAGKAQKVSAESDEE
ncbi:hypothetical protein AACH06_07440 [Ideonella sp. DXS29W]|uniref:Uncharacterized protein n=1 Tax=Ideonella lacteola TaxID=2984193 RepID=A0ABU9BL22_9BURK